MSYGLPSFIPFVFPFMDEGSSYRWTQKTIYREPVPNHALHISKAEEKRKRKAEKLIRTAGRAALAKGGGDE